MLLGAIGGPEWGTGAVRPEQGLLRLRRELQTYGNLRPCSFASEALVAHSPLRADVCRGTDFTIVRELTGGIYFGERREYGEKREGEGDGGESALDTEPYTRAEVERVARLAAHLALARDPPAAVTSLDKANVLAAAGRLWRRVVGEVFAREFPQLRLRHQLVDSAALLMVKSPTVLNGVVLTSNLFGDILSDEASAIPGSIGLSPSASLSGLPAVPGTSGTSGTAARCNGIYEPIHGTYAPAPAPHWLAVFILLLLFLLFAFSSSSSSSSSYYYYYYYSPTYSSYFPPLPFLVLLSPRILYLPTTGR